MKEIRNSSIIIITLILLGCNNQDNSAVDSTLNRKNNFTQDLGSIMLDIQARHAKLYYAGKNENWELALFFVQELKESFNSITMHHRSHDEVNINKLTNKLMMPTIQKLEDITKQEDINQFEKGFEELTISCNTCHSQSKHSFIRIKKPINGDFLNQEF